MSDGKHCVHGRLEARCWELHPTPTNTTESLDEIAVWFDVEIGHSVCPADETEETCKYKALKGAVEQEVLRGRVDTLKGVKEQLETYHHTTLDDYLTGNINYYTAQLNTLLGGEHES
jgi:hypothetical protein